MRRVLLAEFRTLLAVEPSWTISINGKEFIHVRSSEIELNESTLRFRQFVRTVEEVEAIRGNAVSVRAHARRRRQVDALVFYPGEKLPSAADLRRRRTSFQRALAPVLSEYFRARVTRQMLYSDKQHGVGGAYPRFLVGTSHAVIAVDPDDDAPTINGIMRAAVQWSSVVRRRITAIVPAQRSQTIASRLAALPKLRKTFDWLIWDGAVLLPLPQGQEGFETHVYPYRPPRVDDKVAEICSAFPGQLQAVPNIAAQSVSLRFRGLEVARVTEGDITYPLGQPLGPLLEMLNQERCYGSRHPLACAHQEAWLESNLISQLRDVLPVRQDHVYPQVPSFGGTSGDERKIIDLLTVTDSGRLVVIEIKAASDPDLPMQALDYWLAVERHRKNRDFEANGYFTGIAIADEPALLVLVAPLLLFHRTMDRLLAMLPATLPWLQIGVNQTWKRRIKILRRKGPLG